MRERLIGIKIFVLLIAIFGISFNSVAALPTGGVNSRCHTASAKEIESLNIHGISLPSNGQVCDGDIPLVNGDCPESPYPYLLTKYQPGAASSAEGEAGIIKLNADFACRLYIFFKAADSAGQQISIISAYRSPATQARLFNAAYYKYGSVSAARHNVAPPPCEADTGAIACGVGSRHNMGIAVDLYFGGSSTSCNTPACLWAHAHIQEFQLYFRMGWEPWHVEPSTSVNEGSQIAGRGTGQTTGSGPTPTPPPASPGILTSIKTFFGGGQVPQMQPQPVPYIPGESNVSDFFGNILVQATANVPQAGASYPGQYGDMSIEARLRLLATDDDRNAKSTQILIPNIPYRGGDSVSHIAINPSDHTHTVSQGAYEIISLENSGHPINTFSNNYDQGSNDASPTSFFGHMMQVFGNFVSSFRVKNATTTDQYYGEDGD